MPSAWRRGRTVGSPEIRGSERHPLPGAVTVSKGGSFRILGNFPDSRNAHEILKKLAVRDKLTLFEVIEQYLSLAEKSQM